MAIERKNDLIIHVCSIRRVTRVVTGGKVSRFSALVIVGNGAGKVGFGQGKSVETSEAIRKASLKAQKAMISIPFYQNRTVFHDIEAEFSASKVIIKRAKKGVGLIAGGSMRYVFEALGIKDIVCKTYGSSNAMNIIKATFKGLQQIRSIKYITDMRKQDPRLFTKEVQA